MLVVNAGSGGVRGCVDRRSVAESASAAARKRLQMAVLRLRQALEPIARQVSASCGPSAVATCWRSRRTGSTDAAVFARGVSARGRRADALEVYQRTRERLAEELGLEPSEALSDLRA